MILKSGVAILKHNYQVANATKILPSKKHGGKKFWRECKFGIKLNQLISDELKKELIKNEFIYQYNSVYDKELKNFKEINQNTNPYILQQQFESEVQLAKLNYFRELFLTNQSNFLRLLEDNNYNQIANHAVLRREVLNNDAFVFEVINKLENKVVTVQPQTMVESLARDFYGLYNFNLLDELSKIIAKNKADEFVYTLYQNSDPQLTAKIEKNLQICFQSLEKGVKLASTSKDNILTNPFDMVTNRFEYLLNSINRHVTNSMYNSVLTNAYAKIFNKKFIPQEIRPLSSIFLPHVIEEYVNEFKLIYKNNIAILKLQKDINILTQIQNNSNFEFDLQGKIQEIKFYKMASEFVYESIFIKERQKAIKSVIGEVTSKLLLENENYLLNERIAYANLMVESLVPNCNQEFIKHITNKIVELQKTNGFEFQDYKYILKRAIIEKQFELFLAGKLDVEVYAERVSTAVMLAVEEKELQENSFYKTYINNISAIKPEVNAKRLAEYAKAFNDYKVIENALNYQINIINNIDKNLLSKQENIIIKYYQILNQEMQQVNSKMEEIIKLYSSSPEKQNEFVVTYVNSFVKEFAYVANPRYRYSTMLAYAKPLQTQNVISDISELQKPLEILAKRENEKYVKLENQLKNYTNVISVDEFDSLPLIFDNKPLKSKALNKKEEKQENKIENITENNKVKENETTHQELQESKNPEKDLIIQEIEEIKAIKENLIVELEALKQQKNEKIKTEKENTNEVSNEVANETVIESKVNAQEKNETLISESKEQKQEQKQPQIKVKEEKQEYKTIYSDKTMEQHFKQIEAVNIALIDSDAYEFMKNEFRLSKLDEFETLPRKDQIKILNEVLSNTEHKNLLLDSNTLFEQAEVAKNYLEKTNKALLKKYSKSSDDEKIAFVVLALNKQTEIEKEENVNQEFEVPKTTITYKAYNLDDKKEFNSCKNNMFWKMQLKAVKKNIVLEKTLNDETMEEFNQVAPVVKLFEIAASDNLELSEVKIANIGQLNYQQLARVSILKYKDGKINDPATVDLVKHILSNTSVYAKTQEYLNTIENVINKYENDLKLGLISLDEIIEIESKEDGLLYEVIQNFYKKTTPDLPKLVKIDNDVNENFNITI